MSYDFGDVGETRRRTMQAIGSEGTGPEEQAAEALDALGVGYEDQPRYGRYRPDFVLEDGTVLQVMGAFWHGHPSVRGMDEVQTNEDYWTEKLRKNINRDHRRRQELLNEYEVPNIVWVWEPDPIPEHIRWYCRRLGLIPNTNEHRFWSKVEKRGFNDCWEWQAATDRGYGEFGINGDKDYAHRIAYEMWYGKAPGDAFVMHKHDNRGCVNPQHLKLGGQSENITTAIKNGKQPVGQDHPRGNAKLSENDVRDIRTRYSSNDITQTSLAEEYNVQPKAISDVVNYN